jgi:hypothetical protein
MHLQPKFKQQMGGQGQGSHYELGRPFERKQTGLIHLRPSLEMP